MLVDRQKSLIFSHRPSLHPMPMFQFFTNRKGSNRRSTSGSVSAVPTRKITLGICCMDSKSQGNPMKALLRRLESSGIFEIIVFRDDVILNEPIEKWPKVECLIGFYSNGFPLEKGIEYVRLVKPIEVNELEKQPLLRNRLLMYETLRAYEIPCPDYMFIDHLGMLEEDSNVLEETDDFIIYNGRKLMKPFVEKPLDGDDHNIWIYYPPSVGGGCKKLIRKTDDKSSEFDPYCNKIRRNSAYLYEPFLQTHGLDLKVYMVFSNYSHAEARKAPTVDGKVMRSKDGKEIRYPISLTEFEKVCGALVVQAFGQNFCGFDVLRTRNGPVVCDVNGWSFVKGNQRYYDDAALLLQRFFVEKVATKFPLQISLPNGQLGGLSLEDQQNELHNTYHDHGEIEEDQLDQSSLRAVIIVMRHGDRRPKEKLKFKTANPKLLAYFDKKPATSEILVKSPEDMMELTSTVRLILEEMNKEEILKKSEKFAKFDTLRLVLELQESFEGVTRKVQLKPVEFDPITGRPARLLVVAKWGGELTDMGRMQSEELGRVLRQTLFPVGGGCRSPGGGLDDFDDSLLRLHSSFRHDFKIYSSIEGRCQTTAAAFTKGFLDLEGDLTPILVSLVCYDDFARGLLDEPVPKDDRNAVKQTIGEILHCEFDHLNSKKEVVERMVPQVLQSGGIYEAVKLLLAEGSPYECLTRVHESCITFISLLGHEIKKIADEYPFVLDAQLTVNPPRTNVYQRMRTVSDASLPSNPEAPFTGPGPRLQQRVDNMIVLRWVQLRRIEHRWTKLVYGFTNGVMGTVHVHSEGGNPMVHVNLPKKNKIIYDTSKVTDLWDCAYYDIVHHNAELPEAALAILQRDLMRILIPLQAWVSTAEFGITPNDKLRIGVETTWRLLQKMVNDIEFMLPSEDAEPGSSSSGTNRISGVGGQVHHPSSTPPGGSPISAAPPIVASDNHPTGLHIRGNSNIGVWAPTASGMTTPVAAALQNGRQNKSSKVPPELRALLRQAMRDGSDWHPQLHETVAQITGMKSSKCVRTRVYVTSASTMHSLLNVFAFGNEVSDENPVDRNKIAHVTDLQYLSHFVIRCFEEAAPLGDASNRHSAADDSQKPSIADPALGEPNPVNYRVEVLFSPGVQCKAQPLSLQVSPDLLRENQLCVVPVTQILQRDGLCSLDEFDTFLTEILAELGKLSMNNNSQEIPNVSSPRMAPSPI